MKVAGGIAALAVAGAIFVPNSPANAQAEDKRPCVSTTEYHQTRDVPSLRLKTSDPRPVTRQALEDRWEVRGLGTIDPAYSGPAESMWVYEVCGYSYDEAQVWVMVHNKNQHVEVISLWKEAGAMSNGHEF